MIHDLTDVKLWSIQLFNWSDEIISHRHFHWIALRECSPHQVTYSTIIKGINILLCIKQLKCWESWNKAVPWGRKEGSSLSVVGSPRRRLHCCLSAFTFYYFWQSYKLGKKPAPSRRFSSFFLQPKKKNYFSNEKLSRAEQRVFFPFKLWVAQHTVTKFTEAKWAQLKELRVFFNLFLLPFFLSLFVYVRVFHAWVAWSIFIG